MGHGSLLVGMALNSLCQSLKTQEAVRSQAIKTSNRVSWCKAGWHLAFSSGEGNKAQWGPWHAGQPAPASGCSHSGWLVALGNYASGVARFLSFSREARFLDFYCEVLSFLNCRPLLSPPQCPVESQL